MAEGACRICGLEEERDGLCPGHREEWIQWAANRPWTHNDHHFEWWVETRASQVRPNDPVAERMLALAKTHPADPPHPVPTHLTPWGGQARGDGSPPLGPEDLRIAPATNDLREIARLIEREKLADAMCLLTQRDGSPWIEIDIAKDMEVSRFALWRYTGAIYRVGDDGAVEDDPIQRPADG